SGAGLGRRGWVASPLRKAAMTSHGTTALRGARLARRGRILLAGASAVLLSGCSLAAAGELLDGRTRRGHIAGHAQRFVIAKVVLLLIELRIGDIAARRIDSFDPGGGDGFRAQQKGVDAAPSRFIDLGRRDRDGAGELQRLFTDLALEQSADVSPAGM